MKKVYAYVRVSDPKQGLGVSLQEQEEAIVNYAIKHNLDIVQWFKELKTAAKKGARKEFSEMMKQLAKKKVDGVIIHKIDRSMRNLHDWSNIGDLIDDGIEVFFAHESLDLHTRGGRLAADIQAVVASDYIRNLRQESIKGLYGRIKQGLYPFAAPLGYINNGRGNVKTIDPEKGILVKKLFQTYATGKYNYKKLLKYSQKIGLKGLTEKNITHNQLTKMFNNPFYIGMMKVKGKIYQGKHKALVSPKLYKQVQQVLRGVTNNRIKKHEYLFRKMISCSTCGYSLIGEKQKGRVYYRCHTKNCTTKNLREDYIDIMANKIITALQFQDEELSVATKICFDTKENFEEHQENLLMSIRLRKAKLNTNLDRLTDAFIESYLNEESYNLKREKYMIDLKDIEIQERKIIAQKSIVFEKVNKFLELSKTLKNKYNSSNTAQKRKLLKIITSNLTTQGKNVVFSMVSPFYEVANRHLVTVGDLVQAEHRIQEQGLISSDNKNPVIIYSEKNTSPILGKPLSKSKITKLINFLIQHYSLLSDITALK